jgi:hypothetical protein
LEVGTIHGLDPDFDSHLREIPDACGPMCDEYANQKLAAQILAAKDEAEKNAFNRVLCEQEKIAAPADGPGRSCQNATMRSR